MYHLLERFINWLAFNSAYTDAWSELRPEIFNTALMLASIFGISLG